MVGESLGSGQVSRQVPWLSKHVLVINAGLVNATLPLGVTRAPDDVSSTVARHVSVLA